MWEEDLESASRRKVAWLIGIVVAVVLGLGGWYWYKSAHHPPVEAPVARAAPPPAPPANPEPQVAHPLGGDAATGAGALPALNDSDQVVHDSLAGVIGRHPV